MLIRCGTNQLKATAILTRLISFFVGISHVVLPSGGRFYEELEMPRLVHRLSCFAPFSEQIMYNLRSNGTFRR